MEFEPEDILSVLDRCCDAFTFPMLDNGYVYLAATRLSLYRSAADWAMVLEMFGFSPRAGLPNTHIHTFASTLHDRAPPESFVDWEAYENEMTYHPHDESRFVHPVSEGPWKERPYDEFVAPGAREIVVRGRPVPRPAPGEYARHGIELEQPPRVRVYELCRYLADVAREKVLATPQERRGNVPPELRQVLQLEEWHHPDVADAFDRPSGSETFQQLARVLVTGNRRHYRPSVKPNTHWSNWPMGGQL
jgi:hypothetical protein